MYDFQRKLLRLEHLTIGQYSVLTTLNKICQGELTYIHKTVPQYLLDVRLTLLVIQIALGQNELDIPPPRYMKQRRKTTTM